MFSISLRLPAPVLASEMLATRLIAIAAQTRQRLLAPRVILLDPHLAADAGIDRYTTG